MKGRTALPLSRSGGQSFGTMQSLYSDEPPSRNYHRVMPRSHSSEVRGSQFRIPSLEAKQKECDMCLELRKQIKLLKAKLEELRSKGSNISDAALRRAMEAEDALAAALLKIDRLENEVADLQGNFQADKLNVDDEAIETLKRKLHAQEEQSRFLQQEVDKREQDKQLMVAEYEQKLQENSTEIAKLRDTNASLRAQLEGLGSKVSPSKVREAESQASEWKQKLEDMVKQSHEGANDWKRTEQELQNEIEALRLACTEKDRLIDERTVEYNGAVQARDQSETKCSEQKVEIGSLTQEIERLNSEFKAVSGGAQERDAMVARLKEALSKANMKAAGAEKDAEELRTEMSKLKAGHRKELGALQMDVRRLQQQLDMLSKAKQQAQSAPEKPNKVVVITPRIYITVPSGQSAEYGTMSLPPAVIKQLVTQQLGYEPEEIIPAKNMEEVHQMKKKL